MPARKQPGAVADRENPGARKVTRRQAEYLAGESGLEADRLAGQTIAEVHKLLEFRLDPALLFFRRICGRVVKRDPVTGVIYGVPNATVHIEDTDCTFLGFFPVEQPLFHWLWPIRCRREVLATTQTDECGNFCVWVPRWDIDRILHWRLKRKCYPDIFRPRLRDLLDRVIPRLPEPPFPPDPNPPDPPFARLDLTTLGQLGSLVGRDTVERLAALDGTRTFGAELAESAEVLDMPLAPGSIPPPITTAALKRLGQLEGIEPAPGEKGATPAGAASLVDLVVGPPIGPFLRCRWVLVPEWHVVFDVPDITFRVTQDVDGDGDEEVIYSEGSFDVRWNAGPIPNVILEASPLARHSVICHGPDVPCGNVPSIETVGLMPLIATHHNNATGLATRVNRPRPGGLSTSPPLSPAFSPYAGTLQLHGCHHIGGAPFYRLVYRFNGGPEIPFVGLEWFAPRLGGGAPFHVQADGAGWYPVLPANQLVFPHWLLNWPTSGSGVYDITLQLGNAAKAVTSQSATVRLRIDNATPAAGFSQLRWRPAGGSFSAANTYSFPFGCIVIERPTGADIEIEVSWSASAQHYRSASIAGSGCGGDAPEPVLPPASNFDDWHQAQFDNAVARTALFTLAGSAHEGAYGFHMTAVSRAFNPAGDGGGPAVNWLTDYTYIYRHVSLPFALIDA